MLEYNNKTNYKSTPLLENKNIKLGFLKSQINNLEL